MNEFKSGFDFGVELSVDIIDDYLVRYGSTNVGDVLTALKIELKREAAHEKRQGYLFAESGGGSGIIAALLHAVGFEADKYANADS